MPFTNKCPISHEQLIKESALLIKVPKQNDTQKDIYFYIGDEETLEKLAACPFSRRIGQFYALKLSSKIPAPQEDINNEDVASKLVVSNDKNTLTEDNEVLSEIDTTNQFNWQLKQFKESTTQNQFVTGFQEIFTFNDNRNQTFLARGSVPNHQLISEFKSNFLRHPLPRNGFRDLFLTRNNIRAYERIMNRLLSNSLKEEHDLLFLFNSYRLISELENSHVKITLQNAVYVQLSRYVAGLLVMTNTMSLMVHLFDDSLLSLGSGVLKILLINSAQLCLERLFKKNKSVDFNSIVQAIFIDSIIQLTNTTRIYDIGKNAVSNAYDFVKTNLSFFYNKWIKPEPVHYELPLDLDYGHRQ
jgi:hypothetical protein